MAIDEDRAPVCREKHGQRIGNEIEPQGDVFHQRHVRRETKVVTGVDRERMFGRKDELPSFAGLDCDGLQLRRIQEFASHRWRDNAAGCCFSRERCQSGRCQAIRQPDDAKVGNRGDEDQHFGQHHEQRGQTQQFPRQAKTYAFGDTPGRAFASGVPVWDAAIVI